MVIHGHFVLERSGRRKRPRTGKPLVLMIFYDHVLLTIACPLRDTLAMGFNNKAILESK